MVIAVHLALFQVILYSALCTRHTFAKQKQNLFDKNSVGRLSVGFGKRVSELKRKEVIDSGKATRESSDADDTILFNDILDRLSYGYGKRAMDIYKNLEAQEMQGLQKRTTLGSYADDDIMRQRLIDILVKNIKQTSDLSVIDNWDNEEEDLSTDFYDEYDNSIR